MANECKECGGDPVKVRRFKHTSGFGDGTRWIEVKNGKSYLVNKQYKRIETAYTLATCLTIVRSGDWIEF